jgi:hypothetical protein
MALSCSIIRDGKESYRINIPHRDWGLLHGPFFEAGRQFIDALGIYQNFTVAGGLPAGTQVKRDQILLLKAAECLRIRIQSDEKLLRYDYTYSFATKNKTRHSGAQSGFLVRGLRGYISTRPHGFCYLKLSQRDIDGEVRIAEIIDMRVKGSIETDELGTLKIYRKKAEINWLEILPL